MEVILDLAAVKRRTAPAGTFLYGTLFAGTAGENAEITVIVRHVNALTVALIPFNYARDVVSFPDFVDVVTIIDFELGTRRAL